MTVTTRCAALGALLLMGVSCGGSGPTAAPVAPTPTPAPTSRPAVPFSLSGTVADVYSGRPIPGASINVYASGFNPAGRFGVLGRVASLTSDASGHYELSTIPDLDALIGGEGPIPLAANTIAVYATQNGYTQPCAATTAVVPGGRAVLNIQFAPAGGLAAVLRVALISPPGSRLIFGSVFETTADGRRPVQGAWVGWEQFFDAVIADTRSDIAGNYVLCSLPLERFELFAVRTDRIPSQPVNASVEVGASTVDIELPK